jgi:hypothetical protein
VTDGPNTGRDDAVSIPTRRNGGAAYLTIVDAAYFELARSWRNLVTDAANDHPARA